MERCEQCGNAYAQTFHIRMDGKDHVFDCFECAIEKLAPRCHACKTRIMGHGLEAEGQFYCCASCARLEGIVELKDHVPNL